MRSSLSVVSRVIRRRNVDKGAEVKACWRRRPVGCLWALSARLDALPGRVVSGCCVALVSVVAGDDICVKVSTSCCECSVSVQDGNTFASVELLMPLHPATQVKDRPTLMHNPPVHRQGAAQSYVSAPCSWAGPWGLRDPRHGVNSGR